MALIPEDKIAEVRDRTDIVQVVGDYVSLRKSGINHKGLCPFHAEKTPSFNVNSAKQIFHCFGCGKSGDVISFLMEMEGRSFLEVVRELARRAGITLPEREEPPGLREARARNDAEKGRLVAANQLAADFYRAELASPRGMRPRAYVEGRGVDRATLGAFQVGYAPAGWDGLVRFFESKRVPHEVAERAGLVRARDGARLAPGAPPTKATHFDMFRDRVMFPVINLQGEIVGFSGRIIEGDGPKYINTPETALFKKGEQLFGLHAAKQSMRKLGRAILVEGNFDVLMMHVHGLTETVAPMGTALTPAQAHLLHRFAPERVYLFLDGDAAGYRAAARDVGVFLDEEMLAFVALIPKGEDPDTLVRKHGRGAVDLLLKGAKEAVEYFCDHVWTSDRIDSIPGRVKLIEEEVAPILRRVKNETARQRYAEGLALSLDLPRDSVMRALRERVDERARQQQQQQQQQQQRAAAAVSSGGAASNAPNAPGGINSSHVAAAGSQGGNIAQGSQAGGQGAADEKPTLVPTDQELLALIADHPRLLLRLGPLGVLRRVRNDQLREALTMLARRSTTTVALDARALVEAIDPALRAQVMQAAMSGRYAEVPDPERALRSILKKCEQSEILAELKATLQAARAAGDEAHIKQLNARITELQRQRFDLA